MPVLTERVREGIISSRQKVGEIRGYEIYPETPVCRLVCEEVLKDPVLNQSLDLLYINLPYTNHWVLRTKDKQKIFDPQYKQFVPEPIREMFPDVLVIEKEEIKNLQTRLQQMGVSKEVARAYLKSL